MLDSAELLALAQAYSKSTGFTLTGIGKKACGNDKAFLRLERGDSITTRTAETVEQWFRGNWPENAEWPKDVPGKPRRAVPAVLSRRRSRAEETADSNA